MLQAADPGIQPLHRNITGDDEDSLFLDWVQNMLYLDAHRQAGFVLKNPKQSTGEMHEFLQRQAGPGFLPTRPLASLLAQLASGNWYKDVHIWYDSAISSLSDNLWEAHLRGMPLVYARRLATNILNATMRVPLEKELQSEDSQAPTRWKELEWWTFRHGSKVHALWAGTKGPQASPPAIAAKPAVKRTMPSKAADALIRQKARFLDLSEEKWDRYKQEVLKESYASLNLKARSDAHRDFARYTWPDRKTDPTTEDMLVASVKAPALHVVLSRLSDSITERRPTSQDEILARLELDAQLLSLAGGWNAVVRRLPPHMMSKFEWPSEPAPVPMAWRKLDPAIQSWIAMSGAVPIYDQQTGTKDRLAMLDVRLQNRGPHVRYENGKPVFLLFMAPNGGGKSTYAAQHSEFLDLDKAVIDTGTYGAYKTISKSKVGADLVLPSLQAILWRELRNGDYRGWLAQYQLSQLVPNPNEREFVVQVYLVDVPEHVIEQRLAARGWTQNRIDKRKARWLSVKSDAMTTRKLSKHEKETMQILHEWPKNPWF
jgi:predicted kinase